jgi:hypothetical protein
MTRELQDMGHVAAGLVVLMLAASNVHAQTARRTPGFWVAGIASSGSARLTCSTCGTTPGAHVGVAPGVGLGYSLSRNLAVGVELSGIVTAHDGIRERFSYLTAGFVAYPLKALPVAVEAGGGLARYIEDIRRSEAGGARDNVRSTGPAWRAALSYDVAVSPAVSIVPRAQISGGTSAELQIGGVASGYRTSHHLFGASIAVVWNLTATPFALRHVH